MRYSLVIGNKNYSSWSLRPWILMKQAAIEFDEILIPLFEEGFKEELLKHSPAGKVPILKADDHVVWDSLAICEFISEQCPAKNLWPEDGVARAHARSVAAEMHSGFFEVRSTMPMNIRKTFPRFQPTEATQGEIQRIEELWTHCRKTYGAQGPFLFGGFSVADAMYAPVVSRFETYGIRLNEICETYRKAILGLPAMVEWFEAARAESWIIEEDEI